MMRYIGFLVLFIGMFGLFRAASEIDHNLSNASLLERCQKIFKSSCSSIPKPNSTLPPTNESECVCVPHYLCTKNSGVVITDGSGVITGRIGEETPPNNRTLQECTRWDQLCCYRTEINNTISNHKPTLSQVPAKKGCGHSNPNGVLVSISNTGNQAQFAEFPWMVAVLQNVSDSTASDTYKCGGSLIHPRAVLTAAHNVEGSPVRPTDLFVRAGEWDIKSLTEPIQHQERQVETIILHKNFNSGNLRNDAAILILKTAFDIAPNVNIICLPQETDVFDDTRCIATGWGKDKAAREGKFQSILKKIVLPVMPHDLCETRLRTTRVGPYFILDRSFICAGGEPNQDTCTGDGGSPLVCPMRDASNRYVQAGIVSWGIGCGQDQLPGVYASVSELRPWIDSTLASNGL